MIADVIGRETGRSFYIFCNEDDGFDLDTMKCIEELGIIYDKGVTPIRILQRENMNPLVQIGFVDDYKIGFDDRSLCIDSSWIDSLIDCLCKAKRKCEEIKQEKE